MFEEAAAKYSLDLESCFVVGDYWSDIEAARRIGARSILIWGSRIVDDKSVEPVNADATCADMVEAAEKIRRWFEDSNPL